MSIRACNLLFGSLGALWIHPGLPFLYLHQTPLLTKGGRGQSTGEIVTIGSRGVFLRNFNIRISPNGEGKSSLLPPREFWSNCVHIKWLSFFRRLLFPAKTVQPLLKNKNLKNKKKPQGTSFLASVQDQLVKQMRKQTTKLKYGNPRQAGLPLKYQKAWDTNTWRKKQQFQFHSSNEKCSGLKAPANTARLGTTPRTVRMWYNLTNSEQRQHSSSHHLL